MADIKVRGLAELNKFLDQLPGKLAKNVMRSALRQGANVIRKEARSNVPVRSGELRKSLRVSTRSQGLAVTAKVVTNVRYAALVEYGTKAHFIAAKGKGVLAFGGIFAKGVNHPGARPNPFMRRAMDVGAAGAVVAVGEKMRTVLATKHGLDTASVEVSEG